MKCSLCTHLAEEHSLGQCWHDSGIGNQCPCREAIPENDEFQCSSCNFVFDIDESIRLDDNELYCTECATNIRLDYPEEL